MWHLVMPTQSGLHLIMQLVWTCMLLTAEWHILSGHIVCQSPITLTCLTCHPLGPTCPTLPSSIFLHGSIGIPKIAVSFHSVWFVIEGCVFTGRLTYHCCNAVLDCGFADNKGQAAASAWHGYHLGVRTPTFLTLYLMVNGWSWEWRQSECPNFLIFSFHFLYKEERND